MSPSKTPRKIDIFKELLHSIREWLRFIDFRPPNGSQTLPLATLATLATLLYPPDSQAQVPQAQDPKQKIPSERSQVEGPKPKFPS